MVPAVKNLYMNTGRFWPSLDVYQGIYVEKGL